MKEFAQQGRSWQGKMEAGADGWVPERMLFHSFSTGEQAVRARAREGEDSGGAKANLLHSQTLLPWVAVVCRALKAVFLPPAIQYCHMKGIFVLFIFLTPLHTLWDLSSQPGIKVRPPAVEAQYPNHWTTRESP